MILEKNIFGLDICDRAAQLADFALLMKAREDDRRILERDDLKLNVMAICESNESDINTIEIFFHDALEERTTTDDADIKGGLKKMVKLFENAKTFGFLITVPETLAGKKELFETALQKNIDEMFKIGNIESLQNLLRQMENSVKYFL